MTAIEPFKNLETPDENLVAPDESQNKVELGITVGQNFSDEECSPDNCSSFAIYANIGRLKIGNTFYNGCGPWHNEADKMLAGESGQDEQFSIQSVTGVSQVAASSIERGTTSMFYAAAKYPVWTINLNQFRIVFDAWGGLGLLNIKDIDRDITLARESNILVQRGSTYPVFHTGVDAKIKIFDLYITGHLAYSHAFTGDPTFEGATLDGPTKLDVGGLSWAEWRVGLVIPVEW